MATKDVLTQHHEDPTRDELIAYLESVYSIVTCGETCHTAEEAARADHEGCACRFDIEEAAYYIATHCHGGMWTNLYSVASTSPFQPGAAAGELPDDEERWISSELYRAGCEWIGVEVTS